jgi:hypothetical protein
MLREKTNQNYAASISTALLRELQNENGRRWSAREMTRTAVKKTPGLDHAGPGAFSRIENG